MAIPAVAGAKNCQSVNLATGSQSSDHSEKTYILLAPTFSTLVTRLSQQKGTFELPAQPRLELATII